MKPVPEALKIATAFISLSAVVIAIIALCILPGWPGRMFRHKPCVGEIWCYHYIIRKNYGDDPFKDHSELPSPYFYNIVLNVKSGYVQYKDSVSGVILSRDIDYFMQNSKCINCK